MVNVMVLLANGQARCRVVVLMQGRRSKQAESELGAKSSQRQTVNARYGWT